MTRTMYDGIDPFRLPTSAQIVAGYVDGKYAWSTAGWNRFPHSIKVRIAVFATTNDGHVLDCEPGNCTPAESVDWVIMRRVAGADPTVYCNQLDPVIGWPAVRGAFQARKIPEPHYWVADYDGVTTVPAGAVAKQYENDEVNGWDLSVVADHWPGVDSAPDPSPTPVRRDDMPLHLDLYAGDKEKIFTNPAAVLGGTSTMYVTGDFGSSTLRLATLDFNTGLWTVAEHVIESTGLAMPIQLPATVNKVGVSILAGTGNADWPVGIDVY